MGVRLGLSVCMRVCACLRVWVHVCVCLCVCVGVCVWALVCVYSCAFHLPQSRCVCAQCWMSNSRLCSEFQYAVSDVTAASIGTLCELLQSTVASTEALEGRNN